MICSTINKTLTTRTKQLRVICLGMATLEIRTKLFIQESAA